MRTAFEQLAMLQDELVGGRGADRLADVPERSGPDLAIGVDLVDQVSRVLLVPIDPPQARRRGAAEG